MVGFGITPVLLLVATTAILWDSSTPAVISLKSTVCSGTFSSMLQSLIGSSVGSSLR